jgi:hypothetical protein
MSFYYLSSQNNLLNFLSNYNYPTSKIDVLPGSTINTTPDSYSSDLCFHFPTMYTGKFTNNEIIFYYNAELPFRVQYLPNNNFIQSFIFSSYGNVGNNIYTCSILYTLQNYRSVSSFGGTYYIAPIYSKNYLEPATGEYWEPTDEPIKVYDTGIVNLILQTNNEPAPIYASFDVYWSLQILN